VKDIYVDGRKLVRNGRKTATLAGGWRRLPIDNEYATLLGRLFGMVPKGQTKP
jgi:hypothetical protein